LLADARTNYDKLCTPDNTRGLKLSQ